ncbi:Inner membrane ABC transporter permease protein YcjO [bioreactor metagenome]|uniref:Inner membrane ABC transporter permease protein YcjO n=1 Tax=bioreactor metagenome TaxID=1076179 RepID=A0A644WZV5_9ZZZZ
MKRLKAHRDTLTGYAFVLPLVIILAAFLAYPIIKAAVMSVQYWRMMKPSANGHYFVGFDNYAKVFKDEFFWNSVWVTLQYMVVTIVARFILGFITALALNTKFKGCGLARALVIIPWAVPEVVACLVWILMYDKDYGIVNSVLTGAGVISGNIGWLLDSKFALPAAMAVNIWKGFPFVAIMLLAGLQGIDQEMYEAATVDGATPFQKLRYITLPSLKPVSMVVFLLLIIWTMKDYAIAYLLAKGGPARSTEILIIFVQQTAFKYFDFGKASAVGMLMLIASCIFTSFYFRTLDKGETK